MIAPVKPNIPCASRCVAETRLIAEHLFHSVVHRSHAGTLWLQASESIELFLLILCDATFFGLGAFTPFLEFITPFIKNGQPTANIVSTNPPPVYTKFKPQRLQNPIISGTNIELVRPSRLK